MVDGMRYGGAKILISVVFKTQIVESVVKNGRLRDLEYRAFRLPKWKTIQYIFSRALVSIINDHEGL